MDPRIQRGKDNRIGKLNNQSSDTKGSLKRSVDWLDNPQLPPKRKSQSKEITKQETLLAKAKNARLKGDSRIKAATELLRENKDLGSEALSSIAQSATFDSRIKALSLLKKHDLPSEQLNNIIKQVSQDTNLSLYERVQWTLASAVITDNDPFIEDVFAQVLNGLKHAPITPELRALDHNLDRKNWSGDYANIFKKYKNLGQRATDYSRHTDNETSKELVNAHCALELKKNGFNLAKLINNIQQIKDIPLEEVFGQTAAQSSVSKFFQRASFVAESLFSNDDDDSTSLNSLTQRLNNVAKGVFNENDESGAKHLKNINNFASLLNQSSQNKDMSSWLDLQERLEQVIKFCELAPPELKESALLSISIAVEDCPDSASEGLDQIEFSIAIMKAEKTGNTRLAQQLQFAKFIRQAIVSESLKQNSGEEALETQMYNKLALKEFFPIASKTSASSFGIAYKSAPFTTTVKGVLDCLTFDRFKNFVKSSDTFFESKLKAKLDEYSNEIGPQFIEKSNAIEELEVSDFSTRADYDKAYKDAYRVMEEERNLMLKDKENELFREYLNEIGIGR